MYQFHSASGPQVVGENGLRSFVDALFTKLNRKQLTTRYYLVADPSVRQIVFELRYFMIYY